MIPDMRSVLPGFESPAQFAVVSKSAADFQTQEIKAAVETFYGVFAPMTPQQLKVKPEGERAWRWWTLHTEIRLETDWVVKDQFCTEFRVMSKKNWSTAGYFEYELVEKPA